MEQKNAPTPPTIEQPTVVMSPEATGATEAAKRFCVNAIAKVLPKPKADQSTDPSDQTQAISPPPQDYEKPLTWRESHRESSRRYKVGKKHDRLVAERDRQRMLRGTHGSPDEVENKHPGQAERSRQRYLEKVDGLSEFVDIGKFTSLEQEQASNVVESFSLKWLKTANKEVDKAKKNGAKPETEHFSEFCKLLSDLYDTEDENHRTDFRDKLLSAIGSLTDKEKLIDELKSLGSIKSESMSAAGIINLINAAPDEFRYESILRRSTGLAEKYDKIESPSNASSGKLYDLAYEEVVFGEKLAEAKEARGQAYFRGFLREAGLSQTADLLDQVMAQYPDAPFQGCLKFAVQNSGEKVNERLDNLPKITPPSQWGMGNLGPKKHNGSPISKFLDRFLEVPEEEAPRLLRSIHDFDRTDDNQPVYEVLGQYMHGHYPADSLLEHPQEFIAKINRTPGSSYERREQLKTLERYHKSRQQHDKLTADLEKLRNRPKIERQQAEQRAQRREQRKDARQDLKDRAIDSAQAKADNLKQRHANYKNRRAQNINNRASYIVDPQNSKIKRGLRAVHPGNVEPGYIYKQVKELRKPRKNFQDWSESRLK